MHRKKILNASKMHIFNAYTVFYIYKIGFNLTQKRLFMFQIITF